ncbi:MAG: hypothetical protein H0Z39_08280 [Peptococcaceae bacterium]|nr:hypothetical protein [Peptococcaceae bacterium]
MTNPWLFTLIYIFITAGLVGLVFLAVWFIIKKRQGKSFNYLLTTAFPDINEELDTRLANLENRVDRVITLLEETNRRLQGLEERWPQMLREGKTAGDDYELWYRVGRAFEEGRSVEDLARELGRGKGEIELMINLYRLQAKASPKMLPGG